MLYQLVLSPRILAPLTQAVNVQMVLLRYAANKAVLDNGMCAAAIEADAGLAGRGTAVARWIWNSQNRLVPLQAFAAGAGAKEKSDWVDMLAGEVDALLNGTPASLTPVNERLVWQKGAAAFLQQFYEDLGGKAGLPAQVVGESEPFDRHDFLREFSTANQGIYVCGSCDEARIGTRRNGRLISDIDHFFPKSVYPHLSVHPYNLVPICHSCNSYTKGSIDPLGDAGARCLPSDLVLPYRSEGLSTCAFVAVDLDAWRTPGQPFTFKPRKPDGASDGQIDGVARVADIPGRWNEAQVVDEIGETAFRRLGQFLRAQGELVDDPARLLDKLDEFLGVLQSENLRRDPLTFPIQWLLAHLAHGARTQDPKQSPLVGEIRGWLPPPSSRHDHQKLGAEFRKLLSD